MMSFKLFLSVLITLTCLGNSPKVRGENNQIIQPSSHESKGTLSSVLMSEGKKVVLGFYFPVEASVNQIYKTNQNGVLFKALKISKKSKKIFGVFSDVVNKNEVFIFGIYPKIEAVKNKSFKNKLSYSAFYTISFGSFIEEIQSVTTKSTQDSPLTIGGSMNLKFHDLFSYSGSVYFSKLNSAISINSELQSNNKVVDIPWEYGLTSYLEYSGINFYLKPYTGFDYESFSTYNTDELAANTSVGLDVRTHSFLYGTVGVYGFTNFFQKRGIFKASISTNFTSASSRSSQVSNKDFNGQKFILFFASNIFQNWGASILYKRHMMSGPTDLTISRFGLGVSYRFQ